MSSKKNRSSKNKDTTRKKPKNMQRRPKLRSDELEPGIPIVGIPVTLNMSTGHMSIAGDEHYTIRHDETSTLEVSKVIPRAYIDRLHAVSNAFVSAGLDQKKREALAKYSWPQVWEHFTSSDDKQELQQRRLYDKTRPLMQLIGEIQFGKFLYSGTDVPRFLDGWIEVAWIDYVIREELSKYEKRYDPRHFTLGIPFEFNVTVARCWMTLENCIIRIVAMRDRLLEYVLSLYLFGQTFEELKLSWKEFDRKITSSDLLNPAQRGLYDKIKSATLVFEKGDFKKLRNRVVHEFVNRAHGAVPTGEVSSDTPRNIEDLHKAILDEISHAHELVLLVASLIVAKTPQNEMKDI